MERAMLRDATDVSFLTLTLAQNASMEILKLMVLVMVQTSYHLSARPSMKMVSARLATVPQILMITKEEFTLLRAAIRVVSASKTVTFASLVLNASIVIKDIN